MIDNKGYRKNVGIVLMNNKNQFLIFKRIGADAWQFPQGGIDKNERPIQAMYRELLEETNIKSVKILKEIEKTFVYELPPNLLGKIWKGKFRGQKQRWFIVRFFGDENEINLETQNPEFIEWKWINFKLLPNVIVDFKKNVYDSLTYEIEKFIN